MSKVSNQLVTLCKANLFVRQGYEADEVWGQADSPADRESLKHLHSALTECLALHKFYKVYTIPSTSMNMYFIVTRCKLICMEQPLFCLFYLIVL